MFSQIKKENFARFLRQIKEEKNRYGFSRFSECLYLKRPVLGYFFQKDLKNESLFKIAQRSYLPWTLQDTFVKYYMRAHDRRYTQGDFDKYRIEKSYPKGYFNIGLDLSNLTRAEISFLIDFLKSWGVVPRNLSSNPTNYWRELTYCTYLIINNFGEMEVGYVCEQPINDVTTFCQAYVKELERFLIKQLPFFKRIQYRFWKKFNKNKTLYETSILAIEKMQREQTPSH